MFPMIRRCLIYGKKNIAGPERWENDNNAPWYDEKRKYGTEISGALANGYTVEEVDSFFDDLVGFGSYAFNRSHSAAYGYISFLEAWLKHYYPAKYMSALLSMQDTDEDKDKYIKTCAEDNNITVSCPDINLSERNFVATSDNTISYGLASIRGIGEAKIEAIINNRPYNSIQDMIDKLPKSVFNKTIGENLIKSGALDSICGTNRYKTLNQLYDLRKDSEKKVPRYNPDEYDRKATMDCEVYTLGTSVTYKSKWYGIDNNRDFRNENVIIKSVKNHIAKTSNKAMGFVTIDFDGTIIEGVVFPKTWAQTKKSLLKAETEISIDGKKDIDGKLIINRISEPVETANIPNAIFADPFGYIA